MPPRQTQVGSSNGSGIIRRLDAKYRLRLYPIQERAPLRRSLRILYSLARSKGGVKVPEPKDLLDKIGTHLEFLGYSVEVSDGSDDVLVCKHDSRLNVILFASERSIVMHAGLRTELKTSKSLLSPLNELNGATEVSRVSVDMDGGTATIAMRAWHPAAYARQEFSDFMDLFHAEQQHVLQVLAPFIM